jgi:hypothetical protein
MRSACLPAEVCVRRSPVPICLSLPTSPLTFTETLVPLGVVAASGCDRYRLVPPAGSFGGTLGWHVERELRRWLGSDVATRSSSTRGASAAISIWDRAGGQRVILTFYTKC